MTFPEASETAAPPERSIRQGCTKLRQQGFLTTPILSTPSRATFTTLAARLQSIATMSGLEKALFNLKACYTDPRIRPALTVLGLAVHREAAQPSSREGRQR